MICRGLLGLFAIANFVCAASPTGSVQHGLQVPDGFEVVEFADSKLANDIYSLTLDPKGRVVVSGRGYIRILIDENDDGRADRAIEFADAPKDGAMGMLWEKDALYFTGDGGLRRFFDKNGDGIADGPAQLIRRMKTGSEHGAHAIRRGPDGWLYVLCGNSAGIDSSFADAPTSPVKNPVAGCVLRFSPDLKSCEVVADGFRNPYDMDFNADGELFTYDSDNERCVSLPWYEFTRFYHVMDGGHYGWQSPQRAETWRMPPYFLDVVAPLAYLGRGSPTGVVCYRHRQFPERYQGGLFLADWTFGILYFIRLEREGSSYHAQKEIFLRSVGENGFAPTDLAVHPKTGDLYVSIGGRGTRGAVYRIRHRKGFADLPESTPIPPMPDLSLDWYEKRKPVLLNDASSEDSFRRRRALCLLRRHQRNYRPAEIIDAIRANWDTADRYLRQNCAALISHLPADKQELLVKEAKTTRQYLTIGLALPDGNDTRKLVQILADTSLDESDRLAAVRELQLSLGGLMERSRKGTTWEGYSPRMPAKAAKCSFLWKPLLESFPSGKPDLDREISRVLALLQPNSSVALNKISERFSDESDPVEDIHYLIVLARLKGERSKLVTQRTARALLALDKKLAAGNRNRDRNWPLRMRELCWQLAKLDHELSAAMLAEKDFGRADHVIFAMMPAFDRRAAARRFLAQAQSSADFRWTDALVGLVAELPAEEYEPLLRRLWGEAGVDQAILRVLARRPRPADRDKFLFGLSYPQVEVVRRCLDALEKLPLASDEKTLLALVRSMRRLPDNKEGEKLREKLGRLLEKTTGQKLGSDKQAWSDWLVKRYPNLSATLTNADGVDLATWKNGWPTSIGRVVAPTRGKRFFLRRIVLLAIRVPAHWGLICMA
ncbi:MAG: hypothetical protein KatS3mg105_3091 [Gemmatales bacterium]|nr:MAG: hypothetical protein KatS3mg105_3091 [Gemmatales bacterium]